MTDRLPPDMPSRMRALPRDSAGRPVPWFVAWIDGVPDFRIVRAEAVKQAVEERLCFVCGQRRAHRDAAFVVGPMCAVNRTSSEPPSHLACADWSARACPFLTNPQKVRREAHLPDERIAPAGEMIRRNPGVALVWVSTGWKTKPDGQGGTLFDIGACSEARWYAEGRPATRAEVLASFGSGVPILQEMADEEGPEAVEALDAMVERALHWVPA